VCGWLAACIASASALWLIAMSGERPSAISIPVEAPPPAGEVVDDQHRHVGEGVDLRRRIVIELGLGGPRRVGDHFDTAR
jgi:hypothetical protein